ncbi:MAG TPA: hypothetical protein VE645_20305 [Pseudonocardiaceae bacterium]|nr:hypothetical protein [Pseudonocardiaceae bacterium]
MNTQDRSRNWMCRRNAAPANRAVGSCGPVSVQVLVDDVGDDSGTLTAAGGSAASTVSRLSETCSSTTPPRRGKDWMPPAWGRRRVMPAKTRCGLIRDGEAPRGAALRGGHNAGKVSTDRSPAGNLARVTVAAEQGGPARRCPTRPGCPARFAAFARSSIRAHAIAA